MEKKSMGNFIAIMRKAKGMTQRDLADLLHVSDKAVSRWEREESAPDISLIPIIADVLGVTCDELLRGEKCEKEQPLETEEKRSRRIKILLKRSREQFVSFLALPMILAVIGMIAALICNFIFHKATLGFFCVTGCLVISGLLLAAIYHRFRGTAEAEEFQGEELWIHKKYIRDGALKAAYVLVILFGICLPLGLFGQISYEALAQGIGLTGFDMGNSDFSGSTVQIGLQFKTWLIFGGIGGIIAAVLCRTADYFLKKTDRITYAFLYSEEEELRKKKRTVRRAKYVAVCILLLLITVAASRLFSDVMPGYLSERRVFETFEEFKEYMETPSEGVTWGVVDLREQLEHYHEKIYGKNGEVLCEYVLLNEDVVRIEYGNDNMLPITTYTSKQLIEGRKKTEAMMWIWPVVGTLECCGLFALYLKRRKIKEQ